MYEMGIWIYYLVGVKPKYTKCAAEVFFSGINVLKNETILSQGDTTWMRVIAQGVLLLAVLVLVMMMVVVRWC